MKLTLLQVGIYQVFPELLQNSPYACDMTILGIISVNQNVVQIHNDKNVELLSKNLIDKSLEAYKYVDSLEKHHLVLGVTVLNPECGLLLDLFVYSYSKVCTDEISLDKLPSPF